MPLVPPGPVRPACSVQAAHAAGRARSGLSRRRARWARACRGGALAALLAWPGLTGTWALADGRVPGMVAPVLADGRAIGEAVLADALVAEPGTLVPAGAVDAAPPAPVAPARLPGGTPDTAGALMPVDPAATGKAGRAGPSGQAGNPTAPLVTPVDYVVGPGDTLKVTLYDNPELSAEVRVRQSGEVRLPLLDLVPVQGLVVEQIEDLVRSRLRAGDFVKDARVLVSVTAFRSQQVSVLGFVARPGLYPLERPARVSDLLAMAGGVQPLGADEVVLQRGGPGRVRLDVDLARALVDGATDADPAVYAGDTLFVPKAPVYYVEGEITRAGAYRAERALTVQQALASAGGVGPRGNARFVTLKRHAGTKAAEERPVSPDERIQADDVLHVQLCQFYIHGEVQHPGPYRLDSGLTLQQALVVGGGATVRGNVRSLRVLRKAANGLPLQQLDDLPLDTLVQPDDVLFVRERLF